jgi:hypothetical protein
MMGESAHTQTDIRAWNVEEPGAVHIADSDIIGLLGERRRQAQGDYGYRQCDPGCSAHSLPPKLQGHIGILFGKFRGFASPAMGNSWEFRLGFPQLLHRFEFSMAYTVVFLQQDKANFPIFMPDEAESSPKASQSPPVADPHFMR